MLLTIEEVADRLHLAPRGARRMLARLNVPTVKVGKRRLVAESVLNDLIRQHTETPGAPA